MPEFIIKSQRSERAANVLFGLNVWAWGVLGLTTTSLDQRWHAVRLCIATIHVVVGTLFVLRRPLIRSGCRIDIIKAIPAVVLSGFAFSHAGPCSEWPSFTTAIFVSGTVLTIAAFAALAKNFAVLPAVRGVTTSGPYRWVRHPAYLGETILALACCLAKIDAIAVVILLATIVAVVLRARTEEGVFATASDECSAEYAAYRASVRYRIFPGVW